MKVSRRRWGEVTIKKQGVGKNRFDSTRSFSILETDHKYRLEELKEVFEVIVNMTERYEFNNLIKMLNSIDKTSTPRTVSMSTERMTETRGRRDADDR
jgi:hypothetical protein